MENRNKKKNTEQTKEPFKKRLSDKIQKTLKRPWIRAFTNPHLLLCIAIAWMMTNGWSYVLLGIGYLFSIDWAMRISLVYLGILWFPGSPEKLVTFAVAILLLRLFFPKDERTLALLKRKQKQIIEKVRKQFQSLKERFRKRKS